MLTAPGDVASSSSGAAQGVHGISNAHDKGALALPLLSTRADIQRHAKSASVTSFCKRVHMRKYTHTHRHQPPYLLHGPLTAPTAGRGGRRGGPGGRRAHPAGARSVLCQHAWGAARGPERTPLTRGQVPLSLHPRLTDRSLLMPPQLQACSSPSCCAWVLCLQSTLQCVVLWCNDDAPRVQS